ALLRRDARDAVGEAERPRRIEDRGLEARRATRPDPPTGLEDRAKHGSLDLNSVNQSTGSERLNLIRRARLGYRRLMRPSDFLSLGAIATVLLAVLGIGRGGNAWRNVAVVVLAIAAYWQLVSATGQQRSLTEQVGKLGQELDAATKALGAASDDLAEIRKTEE